MHMNAHCASPSHPQVRCAFSSSSSRQQQQRVAHAAHAADSQQRLARVHFPAQIPSCQVFVASPPSHPPTHRTRPTPPTPRFTPPGHCWQVQLAPDPVDVQGGRHRGAHRLPGALRELGGRSRHRRQGEWAGCRVWGGGDDGWAAVSPLTRWAGGVEGEGGGWVGGQEWRMGEQAQRVGGQAGGWVDTRGGWWAGAGQAWRMGEQVINQAVLVTWAGRWVGCLPSRVPAAH